MRRRGKIPIHYAKRDASEAPMISLLEQVGATVEKLNIAGGPDLLVGFRGVTYLLEAKTGKGKVRSNQEDWHELWRGGKVHVVRTPDEALEAIGFQTLGWYKVNEDNE